MNNIVAVMCKCNNCNKIFIKRIDSGEDNLQVTVSKTINAFRQNSTYIGESIIGFHKCECGNIAGFVSAISIFSIDRETLNEFKKNHNVDDEILDTVAFPLKTVEN